MNLQLFGIEAKLNIVKMPNNLGTLKELTFTCCKAIADRIVEEAVKRGFPFERTCEGVKVFN